MNKTAILISSLLLVAINSSAEVNPLSDNGTQYIATGYRQPFAHYDTDSLHTGVDINTPTGTDIRTTMDGHVMHFSARRHNETDSGVLVGDAEYGWQTEAHIFFHADKKSWAQNDPYPPGIAFADSRGDHVHIESVLGPGRFIEEGTWDSMTRHPADAMDICFGDSKRPQPMTADVNNAVFFVFNDGYMATTLYFWDETATGKFVIPTHYEFEMSLKHDQQPGETPIEIYHHLDLGMYNSIDKFPYIWEPPGMPGKWGVIFIDAVPGYNLADAEYSYWRAYAQDFCGNAGETSHAESAAEYGRRLFDFDVTSRSARVCVNDEACVDFATEFTSIQLVFRDAGNDVLGEMNIPATRFCDDCFTLELHGMAANPRTCEITGKTPAGEQKTIITLTTENQVPLAQMGLRVFPNPGNPRICIQFTRPKDGPADVQIYDLAGRLVWAAPDNTYKAGVNQVWWNGEDSSGKHMATGVFLVKVAAGNVIETQKLVLLK